MQNLSEIERSEHLPRVPPLPYVHQKEHTMYSSHNTGNTVQQQEHRVQGEDDNTCRVEGKMREEEEMGSGGELAR